MPHQVVVTVVENEKLAPNIHRMGLESPEIAAEAMPGQFITIECPAHLAFWRRPLSIAQVKEGHLIYLIYKMVGLGTTWLSQRKAGDTIDIIGPLGGRGFTIDPEIKTPVLVGGGVGVAPLFFLCQRLLTTCNDIRPLLLVGAETKSVVILPPYLDEAAEIRIATKDGSLGFAGTVVELLQQTLATGYFQNHSTMIYGSGPRLMLEKLVPVAKSCQIPCEVALETIMACGTGACLGCVVLTKDGPQRVCTEGPVFDGSIILWDQYARPGKIKRTRKPSSSPKVNLAVNIGGIQMKNPVMPAAGTFGYGEEYAWAFDLSTLGAIIPKGIKLEPTTGNPQPRISETNAGMINSIGLQNPGVHSLIAEKMPFLRGLGIPVIVNINGTDIQEYIELARILTEVDGVAGLEVNISCPNVKQGLLFGQNPNLTKELIAAIRRVTHLPLIVKLTPNVTDIVAVGRAAIESGADALCAVNTFKALSIVNGQILLGGQSGRAIKSLALRFVYELAVARLGVPIIGAGGIMSAIDALEFFLVGAHAVQIGTETFRNPKIIMEVIQGIKNWYQQEGISNINEIIGSL